MKILSFQNIFHATGLTIRRYPITLLASACGTLIGILISQAEPGGKENHLWLLLMTFAIAIPLSFALSSLSERRKYSLLVRSCLTLLLLVFCVLFYYTGNNQTLENQVIRFLLFIFASFMFASFSPFLGTGSINGFWQFNKSLLLRFLLSTFFSLVLYLGITIAIFALNRLFGAKIEIAEELWFFTVGIFHTWFFLSGLTADYDGLDRKTDYPSGLKIFTQYVLLPLITLYLLILYAYLINMLITWRFPMGWVSYLVLGFSVTGILALLLIFPLQEKTENRWIRIFARWFFLALLSPVIILLISIRQRINSYGFTENRYLVLMLSLWLAGISLFFVIRKFRSIIIIPVTLCIVTILIVAGPWSVFSVSEKSQQKILTALLIKNNMIKDGKAIKTSTLPNSSREKISSVVDYLAKFHGAGSLQPFFNVNLDSMMAGGRSEDRNEALSAGAHKLLGLPYIKQSDRSFEDAEGYLNFSYSPASPSAIYIKGYDYDLPIGLRHWQDDTVQKKMEGLFDFPVLQDTFHVRVGLTGKIRFSNARNIPMEINLFTLLDTLKEMNSQQLSAQNMSIESENELYTTKFVFTRLSGRKKKHELILRELEGSILIRGKNNN